jgi:PAT family beta-lactamase induction signal transducer AmpG
MEITPMRSTGKVHKIFEKKGFLGIAFGGHDGIFRAPLSNTAMCAIVRAVLKSGREVSITFDRELTILTIDGVEAEAAVEAAPKDEGSDGRPWLFGLLIAPSAVTANGVIQGGVLAYMLSQRGMGPGDQSHVIFLLALPSIIYFLWSPLTDFLVKRRTWLMLGGASAGLLMALSLAQKNLQSPFTLVLMFLAACCSQLVVSSCGGIMGELRSERVRRTAGSFYQGGSLAFGALAALVLIPLSDAGRRGLLGLAAGAMIALPALAAFGAPKQQTIGGETLAETAWRIKREFLETFWRWRAVPYAVCLLFPMNSGAAVGLITGVAKAYGVNGEHVAWMNGFGGAVLMGAGSLAAALISARTRAPVVYLLVGLVNAATLGVTWLGPLTPLTYYVGVTLYLFTTGAGYAYFTAVLLEFLGQSGKSGSGRYSIINSLGNVPVLYMLRLDGWGGDKWGPRGLSGAEAVVSAAGALVLLAYFLTRKPGANERPAAT